MDVSSISNVSINGIRTPFAPCTSPDWKAVHCSSAAVLPVDPDTPSFVEIMGARGILGNSLPPLNGPISWLPAKADVLINEILFNPLQARYDGGIDQSQYVELVNARDHHIYLGDIQLMTKSTTGTSTSTITFLELGTPNINPRGLLVLHADTTSTATSRLSHFFGLTDESNYFRANRSTLSLNSTSGSVWVTRPDHVTLDSVSYDAEFHYPSVRDRRGVSLERISLRGSSVDPRNWGSHGGHMGGSPGRKNSITLGDLPSAAAIIEIQPNPFSPDNDGFEDVAKISLRLQESGWLTKVTIFDRYGRKVRTLADGERVGDSHEIIWDGLDHNNRRAFTGFYVVMVEAWHVEQRKSLSQKKVVGLIHQPRHGLSFK